MAKKAVKKTRKYTKRKVTKSIGDTTLPDVGGDRWVMDIETGTMRPIIDRANLTPKEQVAYLEDKLKSSREANSILAERNKYLIEANEHLKKDFSQMRTDLEFQKFMTRETLAKLPQGR